MFDESVECLRWILVRLETGFFEFRMFAHLVESQQTLFCQVIVSLVVQQTGYDDRFGANDLFQRLFNLRYFGQNVHAPAN